jgi:hypothetical protein
MNLSVARDAGCGRFLNAKLFSGLAVLAAGFTFASPSYPSVLYTPTSTIIFSFYTLPRHMLLFSATASAASALFYFAAARWFSRALNKSLSFVHFAFFGAGVYLIALAVMRFGNPALFQDKLYGSSVAGGITRFFLWPWPIRVLTCGIWTVELGCLAFAVNVGITAIKLFRARQG